jgi:RNA polymerase sigma-70 factor (ECF subfamily)
MTERSDAELVRLIQNGDSAAGGELFQKYGPRIFYLALRDLRSHTDAEDIRAETFLRVLNAIQSRRIQTPERMGSFILSTARNIVLETLRSPLRAAGGREIPDHGGPEANPMLDQEVTGAIEAVLARLKPREREFLRLHYYEDLPKEEIARRIGVDEERVRLIKSRALKSFRDMYERLKKTLDTKGGVPSHKV